MFSDDHSSTVKQCKISFMKNKAKRRKTVQNLIFHEISKSTYKQDFALSELASALKRLKMCFMKNKGEKAQNNAKPGILVE